VGSSTCQQAADSGASNSSSSEATAAERPLGKTYRALVSGIVQPDEVSTLHALGMLQLH
jgi:hypothetical protein